MSVVAGVRLGAYEVLDLLGGGGMGEVYRARDVRLQRIVAVKVLHASASQDDQARARFEREARIIASLNHPHICTLYDIGSEGGIDFLVLEYLEGETLAARIARGALPFVEAIGHAVAIADALAAAHRAGVVHRDLKPGNVMLTRSGPKLLDFGIAKLRAVPRSSQNDAAATTARGASLSADVGTVPYMAPEQLEGRDVDGRSDIFSLGTVLYEMVSGVRPFDGATVWQTVAAVLAASPPPLDAVRPDVPPRLAEIVQTCLARHPDDRWQDAADVRRELEWTAREARSSRGAAALAPTPPHRARRGIRLAVGLLGAGGLLAGALVGLPRLLQMAPTSARNRHVVVLPCANGQEPEAVRVYCEGIAETLTASLARLTVTESLQVTPASEVRARRVTNAAASRRAFGATLALEGNLHRAGDLLRVSYSLVDTSTRKQIDAVSFTAPASDPFTVEDRLAEWVLQSLRVDAARRESARGTQVAGAYEVYLRARGFLLDHQQRGNVERAIELLLHAIELDPKFGAARATLGEAYWLKYETTREAAWVERARTVCAEALALAPQSSSARQCQGTLELGTGEYERAAVEFTAALEVEPTSDAAYRGLARAQERLGDHGAAEATYQRAIALRPGYWAGYSWLGAFYFARGRYADSASAYEKAAALVPENARSRIVLGGVYTVLGRYAAATREYATAAKIDPESRPYLNWGMTLYRMRRFREAGSMLEKALAARADSQVLANLARAVYWAGDRPRAETLYRDAIQAALRELAVNQRDVNAAATLAECYARTGRADDARRYLLAAPSDNPHVTIFAAMTLNQLGDRATALRWIDHAAAHGLPSSELEAWIDLDNLRNEPQFKSSIERTRSLAEAEASRSSP